MQHLLLQKCDVLRFCSEKPQITFNQDILIESNLIKEIVPHDSLPCEDVEKIFCDGMLAIPGMINTHAHVPMTLLRHGAEDTSLTKWFNDFAFPIESNLTPEDVYWGELLGVAEMIQSGITTVADHYFFMDEAASAIETGGIRGELAWAIFEHEGPQKLWRSAEFVRKWQDSAGGRIRTWMGPHSPYLCGPEYLKQCKDIATDLGVGIHLHVSETAQQVEISRRRYGVTPVKLLEDCGVLDVPVIMGHCVYPTAEDLKIMQNHPVGVAHAPKTYLWGAMGMSRISDYTKHNIPVGLASDGPASNGTLDLLEQMRLMALIQKHIEADAEKMTVPEILHITFRGGANVIRRGDLGTIEPGNKADIVLLRQDRATNIPRVNPEAALIYNLNCADIDTVLCDGKILMGNKKIFTLDINQIRREVESRMERLLNNVPNRSATVYPIL